MCSFLVVCKQNVLKQKLSLLMVIKNIVEIWFSNVEIVTKTI